jgi:hypothetical protein
VKRRLFFFAYAGIAAVVICLLGHSSLPLKTLACVLLAEGAFLAFTFELGLMSPDQSNREEGGPQ